MRIPGLKWWSLLLVALIILIADQASKALVVANLGLFEQWMPVAALRPVFTLTYVQNTGAAFGIFPNGGVFFTLIAFVVVGVIVYYYRQIPNPGLFIRIALGLQLGGAVGNLVDRLRLGYVVDFFDVKFWPVFNVADSAIVVGVFLLLVLMWWDERHESQAQAQHPPADSSPEDESSPAISG
jgi:signal peptidase II